MSSRLVATKPNGVQLQSLSQVAQGLGAALQTLHVATEIQAIIDSGENFTIFFCDEHDGSGAIEILKKLNVKPGVCGFLLAPAPSLLVAVQAGRFGIQHVFDHTHAPDVMLNHAQAAMNHEPHLANGRKRRADLLSRINELAPAEHEVFRWILSGVPNKMIAKRLKVSQRTIEARRQKVFRKLAVGSLAELVRLTALYANIEELRAELGDDDPPSSSLAT